MLERDEIQRIAAIKRLSLKNTEKDYLLEMALFLLSNEVGKKLVFKGGTALYKLYSLNRFSEDLDFTLAHSIDADKLFAKIIKKLGDVGINGRIKELSNYGSQKNIKLELRGPLFDGNTHNLTVLTINISLKEAPIYEPEQRKIFSNYSDIPSFDCFVMPMNEMFAEKIRATLTRDKARDVYDIWFLINKGVQINMKDTNKKLKLYKQTFSCKKFIEKIDEKESSWQPDLKDLILGMLPEFKDVRKMITKFFTHK